MSGAPQWAPATLYATGAIVVPRTAPASVSAAISNGGFETGNATGWTLDVGMVVSTEKKYAGTYSLKCSGLSGEVAAEHDPIQVSPGRSITASCMYKQGAADSDHNVAWCMLRWYDQDMTLLREDLGNKIRSGSDGAWNKSTVTAVAPPLSVFVSIGGKTIRDENEDSYFDQFTWDYATADTPPGLVYRAVQPTIGLSATDEPAWPGVVGQQVVDNEVIWEAMLANQVEWTARPILVSGSTEPEWPTIPGEFVSDGSVSWETVTREITDENCPKSKVVAILASKVFAADEDIVRFCATTNCLDWTSERDAGYLPTGLQQANANNMAVLNQYRKDLVALNASSFQDWQVDPDPESMAIVDQMDGIGSVWQQAAVPVSNELYYLAQLGVRSISVAAGSNSLAAGDVGMPIDPLVQPAIAASKAAGSRVVGTYYPSAGQYWLAFADYPAAGQSTVFVHTRAGRVSAWSRYLFPFSVEAFAQLGNDLYVRHDDQISMVAEGATADEVGGTQIAFPGLVQWPWLDMGTIGTTKMMEGFDIVATGVPSVSVGYDQRDPNAFTAPYTVDPDTMPGGIIPLPVSAPTFSLRVEFGPSEKWSLQGVLVYTVGSGGMP